MAMNFGSFATRVVATRVVATDGTGDFTDIQSAINDLPSGGGVVYVKEGTYTITSVITLDKNNISIKGAGKSSIITTSENITSFNIPNTVSNCTIEDIQIKKTGIAEGIGIKDNGTFTIIAGCYVDGKANGIVVLDEQDFLIFGNFISDCEDGITVQGTTQIRTNAQIISNNIQGGSGEGIIIQNVNKNVIANNIIRDNAQNGIVTSEANDLNIIANNVLDGNVGDGIDIDATSDRNVIVGNMCNNNGGYGIRIGASTCNNNLIDGNVVYNNTTGQISDAGTGTVLGDNVTT